MLRCRKFFGVVLLLASLAAGGAAADAEAAKVQGRAAKERFGAGEAKIDLNSAGVEELMRLPGIGRKRADAIVSMRKKRLFRRVREIRRVRGIGRKTFERLLPLITVGSEKKGGRKTGS